MLVVFGRFFKVSVILYIALGVVHVFAARYYPDLTGIIKRINILVGLLFAYNLSAWLLKNSICKVNAFLASASFYICFTWTHFRQDIEIGLCCNSAGFKYFSIGCLYISNNNNGRIAFVDLLFIAAVCTGDTESDSREEIKSRVSVTPSCK